MTPKAKQCKKISELTHFCQAAACHSCPRHSLGARASRRHTMSQSPGDWYTSLPPVCRAWGTACVLTTVGVQLGVLDLRSLYLDFPAVFRKFQIWRLLTNFCFVGGFGFPFVMRMMMMYVFLWIAPPCSKQALETQTPSEVVVSRRG